VYARLNSIRIDRSDKKDFLQENINALLKMAHRDKYINYRDIIYYAAANIELERNNYSEAQNDLLKSVKYSQNNQLQRSQSFLLLADLNYSRKLYSDAYNFYDSTEVNVLTNEADKERVTLRKPPLRTIAENTTTILTQDSLQALANLPPEQRDAIIKKQAKAIRKSQGLKEEDLPSTNAAVKQAPDLFSENNKTTEFYFYNSSLKARGFSEFRARWGERPNVDNWRRKSALDKQVQKMADVDDVPGKAVVAEQKVSDNSYEGLQQNIPLTQEKLDASNKSIMDALFSSGQTFMNKLEEYPAAILAFEDLLRRFPNSPYREEVLFDLVYAFEKTGDKAKAQEYKKQLNTTAPESKFAKLIRTPADEKANDPAAPATKKYEQIYNLFIEGNFDEAINQKRLADSTYGKSFWTPQLLYIESIYYIRKKEDSTAIKVLTDLSTIYAKDAMAARAKTMIDVLKRRKEIEDYLTNLQITRNEDSTSVASNLPSNIRTETKPVPPPTSLPDSSALKKNTSTAATPPPAKKDSIVAPPVAVKNFSFVATDPQYVVILLNKVDPVYATEAQNAFNRFNKEKYYNQKIDLSSVKLNEEFSMVLEGPFTDANAAIDYIDKVRPVAKSRILPWLNAEKFSFLVISNSNLEVLKASKDIDAYKLLIQKALPGKF
jgi:outer membrane protein assembly factor BamD (BamD/ComL family)